jgi:hypothetical protein
MGTTEPAMKQYLRAFLNRFYLAFVTLVMGGSYATSVIGPLRDGEYELAVTCLTLPPYGVMIGLRFWTDWIMTRFFPSPFA